MAKKELQKKHYSLRSFLSVWDNYSVFLRKHAFSLLPQLLLKKAGFTLIELVVAIGVLAILASLAFSAINPVEQFKKAQDLRRKGDLAQIQRALESYYQDNGKYPQSSSNKIAPGGTSVAWGASWSPYIDVLPIDPTSSRNYSYWSDPTGQTYRIYASLDRGSRDDKACNLDGSQCTGVQIGQTCGGTCNYGVTSPNVSP